MGCCANLSCLCLCICYCHMDIVIFTPNFQMQVSGNGSNILGIMKNEKKRWQNIQGFIIFFVHAASRYTTYKTINIHLKIFK